MNKKERLNAIIRYYSDGKPSVFAKYIGVAPSTISSWLSRDTIDYDLIFAKCKNISAEWLLSGKGEMLINNTKPSPPNKDIQTGGIEDKLLNIIANKDATIREQAEEIGHLRERINQLQSEIKKLASAAHDSTIANAG